MSDIKYAPIDPVYLNDMQTRPPPSKGARILFFVPKDAQCSETYAN